ncbi:MAG TPA: hypothetical protein VHW70_09025 [Edaphobacter sp.]|jgi:hypothetical protein|nr:hypothetical protein [Edaphobacter sp.]
MVFMIAYDLVSPNDTSADYQRVIGGIKKLYGTYCHLEKSVFLVETNSTSVAIRDAINNLIYNHDAVFVTQLHGSWATHALSAEKVNWLRGRSF